MEKVVYEAISGDSDLKVLFPNTYQSGAVEDAPQLPFIVYKMVGTTRVGRNFPRMPRLEVWLYQERGSYDLINRGLVMLDDIFMAIQTKVVEDQWISQADPMGWSGYLEDDIYRANTRNAAYHLLGSPG